MRPFDELTLERSTARLRLLPLTTDDVEALWPHVSDPEIPRFMSWEVHRDRAHTTQFLSDVTAAHHSGTGVYWKIVQEETLVGLVSFHDIVGTVRALRIDRAELGYWIGRPFQGRGHATEAAREALRFAFEDLGLHKVIVGAFAENGASVRVIEKLGFRQVGKELAHVFRDGRWWDHLRYELLASDWRRSSEP